MWGSQPGFLSGGQQEIPDPERMGPIQGDAPAALQGPLHLHHNQHHQGEGRKDPGNDHEDGEVHHENPCGGGAGGWAIYNLGDIMF